MILIMDDYQNNLVIEAVKNKRFNPWVSWTCLAARKNLELGLYLFAFAAICAAQI